MLTAWRKAGKDMPVLILTARDGWTEKVQGFDAGADDYVAKPFHLEEVLARLRALVRRATGHASSEGLCGPVSLDARSGRVTVAGEPIKLTSHEYRLLAYLMHHPGRVVSRGEIVERLYDQDFDRDSNTIEVFIGRLRKKLGVDVLQTVRGLGYMLDAGESGKDLPRRAKMKRRRWRIGKSFDKGLGTSSIATRLFLSSAAACIVILTVAGLALTALYRETAEAALDEQPGVYLRALVGGHAVAPR